MNYDDFIGQVQDRARLDTVDDAVKAIRATLETLAERIPFEEMKGLASQLPSELAYYLRQGAGHLENFGLKEFFHRVSRREPADLPDAIYHARAVMSVFTDALSLGEIKLILNALPREFAPLFESGSHGEFEEAA